ncbi:MAG: GntR family transcriptional regulator [Pseudomonadota bacterium]
MPESSDNVSSARADGAGRFLETLSMNWNVEQTEAVSRAPLYHQLFRVLKRAILDGTIPHGAKMPTEQQLSDNFDVSRITSRRAMDELAAEKLIRRKRGKGSHVIYQFRPQSTRAPMRGVLENFIQLGNNSQVRVIEIGNILPPAEIRQLFGLGDTDLVLAVTRVSGTEAGDTYAYYQSWTAADVGELDQERLKTTSRLHLLRDAGLKLSRVEQILGAVNAAPQVADELGVDHGEALLSMRRLSYDPDDRLVDIVDCLYNPQRFQYAMELSVA